MQWPGPLSLWLVDALKSRGLDGYIVASLAGVAYCAVWYALMRGRVKALQALGDDAWAVR